MKLEIKAEDVLKNIRDIAQEAREAEDFGNALKGNELLGKNLKLFTDKVEHSGLSEAAEAFDALTKEEKITRLEQAIERLKSQ